MGSSAELHCGMLDDVIPFKTENGLSAAARSKEEEQEEEEVTPRADAEVTPGWSVGWGSADDVDDCFLDRPRIHRTPAS